MASLYRGHVDPRRRQNAALPQSRERLAAQCLSLVRCLSPAFLPGEGQSSGFTRAHLLSEFGEEGNGHGGGQFLSSQRPGCQCSLDFPLLIGPDDLSDDIRHHREFVARQLGEKTEAPDVREVDQDIGIHQDG